MISLPIIIIKCTLFPDCNFQKNPRHHNNFVPSQFLDVAPDMRTSELASRQKGFPYSTRVSRTKLYNIPNYGRFLLGRLKFESPLQNIIIC